MHKALYLYQIRSPRLFLWVLLSAVATVVLAVALVDTMAQYFRYPVHTSVRESYGGWASSRTAGANGAAAWRPGTWESWTAMAAGVPVPGPSRPAVTFPAVTVCSSHAFSRTRVAAASEPVAASSIGNAEVRALARSAEELVLGCSFGGARCSASELVETLHTDLGACFSFNVGPTTISGTTYNAQSGAKLLAASAAADDGLHLVLDLRPDDALPPSTGLAAALNSTSSTPGSGAPAGASSAEVPAATVNDTLLEGLSRPDDASVAIVIVHDPAERPDPISASTAGAAPGLLTDIAFERHDRTRLPAPHGSCGEREGAGGLGSSYSVASCQTSCRARQVLEQCGCAQLPWPDSLVRPPTAPACLSNHAPHAACVARVGAAVDDGVGCSCPNACTDSSFRLSSSAASWPPSASSSDIVASLRRARAATSFAIEALNIDAAYVQRGIAVVNVRLSTLAVTLHEDVASFPILMALGVAGGLGALLLGASLLTAIECLELLGMSAGMAMASCAASVAWCCCAVPMAMRQRRSSVAAGPKVLTRVPSRGQAPSKPALRTPRSRLGSAATAGQAYRVRASGTGHFSPAVPRAASDNGATRPTSGVSRPQLQGFSPPASSVASPAVTVVPGHLTPHLRTSVHSSNRIQTIDESEMTRGAPSMDYTETAASEANAGVVDYTIDVDPESSDRGDADFGPAPSPDFGSPHASRPQRGAGVKHEQRRATAAEISAAAAAAVDQSGRPTTAAAPHLAAPSRASIPSHLASKGSPRRTKSGTLQP